MALRTCTVSFTGPSGVRHSVEVTAESIYEAAALGVSALKSDGWADAIAPGTELEIQVENSGDSDETGISVSATLNGNELKGEIPALSAGETGTVKIPLTTKPALGTEVTLDVVVAPVLGEQVAENNQATYTVVFGS